MRRLFAGAAMAVTVVLSAGCGISQQQEVELGAQQAQQVNAQLPIILYSKLPGQEDGNVTFVEEEGAGVWAPTPQEVVRTLTRWISRPEEHKLVIENCRRAGKPEAARTIAHIIAEKLGLSKEKE
jgi:hypothetical protein